MFFKDKFIQTKDFKFDAEERDLSSGHRELLATLTFLEDCKQNKVKFSSPIVYWQTDSKNNFIFLSLGSRKPRIQQDIVTINIFGREPNEVNFIKVKFIAYYLIVLCNVCVCYFVIFILCSYFFFFARLD